MATMFTTVVFDSTLKKFPPWKKGMSRYTRSMNIVKPKDDALPTTFEKIEDVEQVEEEGTALPTFYAAEDRDYGAFTLVKRKQKRKKRNYWDILVNDPMLQNQQAKLSEYAPWDEEDRDYRYDELLDRIFKRLEEQNPELVAKEKSRKFKPPKVVRDGTKKTVFVNFQDICKSIRRPPDHVLQYLLTELGSNGNIDGELRLVIKGRFQPAQIETILRSYILEFVVCQGCKSSMTLLTKENRLYFVQCEQCGASRSVAQIKQGYMAQIGRRRR